MNDKVTNEAGEVVRGRTRRLGVTIARQQYTNGKGEASWSKRFYFSKMVNGELARFPLPADTKEAEMIADQIAAFLMDPTKTLVDAKRKFNPRALSRPSNFSTVGDVIEVHQENWKLLEISATSGKGYADSLVLVLRQVEAYRKGTEFASWSGMRLKREERLRPWLDTSLTALTGRLATDYQRLMVPPDLEDEEEEVVQKISCDTNLRCARSLFSKEAMKLYKSCDSLALPDLTDFMAVGLFNAKKFFVMPPVSVVREIFMSAPLLKADDLNAYRAFLICVQGGLRKSEAANLRLDWLQEEDTPVLLIHEDGKFKPKHGHGRKVLLDDWVAKELRATAAAGEYFLDGNETERSEAVFSRLNTWLRKRGVDARKPTHELRKLWFSQKVKRESLLAASQQGGHKDPKITSSFYANNAMPDNVLPFWKEPTLAALARLGLKSA